MLTDKVAQAVSEKTGVTVEEIQDMSWYEIDQLLGIKIEDPSPLARSKMHNAFAATRS